RQKKAQLDGDEISRNQHGFAPDSRHLLGFVILHICLVYRRVQAQSMPISASKSAAGYRTAAANFRAMRAAAPARQNVRSEKENRCLVRACRSFAGSKPTITLPPERTISTHSVTF